MVTSATTVGEGGDVRLLEMEERLAVSYLTIGSPDLVELEVPPTGANGGGTNSTRNDTTTMVRINPPPHNQNRADEWRRLHRLRWRDSLDQSTEFLRFATVVQNRWLDSASTSSAASVEGGTGGGSRRSLGEHFIQPGMSLVDRVTARAAHSHRRRTADRTQVEPLSSMGRGSGGSAGVLVQRRTSPKAKKLLQFADAVRLYVKHCQSRAGAFTRNGTGGETTQTVVPLKELRRYLSGSASSSSNGVHAAMAQKSMEKKTVVDMVERLCDLVPEWIQIVDSERRKRRGEVGGGSSSRYSKDVVIVVRQDVQYRAVRDTILAGGGEPLAGGRGVTKIGESVMGRLGRKGGTNSILNGERKVAEWGQSLTVDVRKDDRARNMANDTFNRSNRVSDNGQDAIMEDDPPVPDESDSELSRHRKRDDASSSPVQDEEEALDSEKDLVVTPESPSSVCTQPIQEMTPESPSSVCTQPIEEDSSTKTSCKDEHDDIGEDNSKSDVETIDQQAPSTPIDPPSTPVSPTSTTKRPRGKLKLGMTLRRRQQRTPSTPLPQRVAATRGKTPATTPTTPHKSSSIGQYFSPKKRKNLGDDLEDDNDSSHPSVVAEDGDPSLSLTPEKKKLRINHSLHLTDSDEYGGRIFEPSATCDPRGLKRLFALLNTGERI